MLRIRPWSYTDLPKLRTSTKAQWLLDGQYKKKIPTILAQTANALLWKYQHALLTRAPFALKFFGGKGALPSSIKSRQESGTAGLLVTTPAMYRLTALVFLLATVVSHASADALPAVQGLAIRGELNGRDDDRFRCRGPREFICDNTHCCTDGWNCCSGGTCCPPR